MTFESSSFEKENTNMFSENIGNEVLLNNKGGTCNVYKINLHGKWVVIKRIKPEYIGNSVIEKSFEKEFEIGFSLEHPHIVKYINKGHDKNGSYIITEFVDGKTLREHFNNGSVFSKEQIRQIVTQLFEAVSYLHKKNVFHLDLKPENILISDKTGNVKLIDFGFSYSDGQLPISTGTKNYIAPGQSSNPESITEKNDLYSLGVIIIELFTNRTDLKGLSRLPNLYKNIVRLCVKPNKEKLVSADGILLTLSKSKVHPLTYLIIGVIILIATMFLYKNKIGSGNVEQEHSILKQTNWEALPSMPEGRADGKALNFEDKIYYISGCGADGGLMTSDVFEFDIKTNIYAFKSKIQTPRAELGAVVLNGNIYTFGGWLGNGLTDTAEVYNIKENSWKFLKPLPKRLTSMSVCSLNDKIYILGATLNFTNTYFYEFDPKTEEYKQKSVFNNSRMNACLVVVKNRIYAIGGNSYKNDNYFVHNDCDVYNVVNDEWVPKTSFPIGITRGSAVVIGDEIHYLGGLSKANSVTDSDALNIHYIYNTKTDVWRNGESLPYRVWGNECVTVNKVIFSFGGYENLPNATGKVFKLIQ